MGQEILYCNKCGTKLLGDDFTRGRAHTIDHKQFCGKCLSVNLTTGKAEAAPKSPVQSTRSRIPSAPPRPATAAAAPAKSRAMLYIGVGVVLAVAAMGLVFSLTSKPEAEPVPAAESPPKSKLAQELKELEPKIAPLLQSEQFVAVIALLEEARKRHDAPEWTGPVARRIKEVQELPAGLYPAVKEKAVAYQTRSAGTETQQLRTRVASWGRKDLVDDLDRTLMAIVPKEPLPAVHRIGMKFPDPARPKYRTTGTLKDGVLHAIPQGDHVMAGFESGLEIFKVPYMGEVRLTYATTSSARITVILRGTGPDGKNSPYHFFIDKPALGVPTAAKSPILRLTDWNNKFLEKGVVIDNIYIRQDDPKAALAIYDFVVFAAKE